MENRVAWGTELEKAEERNKAMRLNGYYGPRARRPMAPGIPFVIGCLITYNIEAARRHFNRYFDCSVEEAKMMVHNFEGEVIYVEFIERYDINRPKHMYAIFSDFGLGHGDSIEKCMYRWRNLDDEDNGTEFARRSRALGDSCKGTEVPYLPELRPNGRHTRGRGIYL